MLAKVDSWKLHDIILGTGVDENNSWKQWCGREGYAGDIRNSLKFKGALMKRRNMSRAKVKKHQNPQL